MASSIVVGINSFVTQTEADTYFTTRWGSAAWTELSESEKDQALVTAYNQLVNAGLFSLPEEATTPVKIGQMEQALFIAVHGSDMLARSGLIAQGVESSQVVKETYDKSMRGKIPICPEALEYMSEYYNRDEGMFAGQLERDDEED